MFAPAGWPVGIEPTRPDPQSGPRHQHATATERRPESNRNVWVHAGARGWPCHSPLDSRHPALPDDLPLIYTAKNTPVGIEPIFLSGMESVLPLNDRGEKCGGLGVQPTQLGTRYACWACPSNSTATGRAMLSYKHFSVLVALSLRVHYAVGVIRTCSVACAAAAWQISSRVVGKGSHGPR